MINVEQLSFKYPGHQQETLSKLSFAIPSGSIFGLLGPSGAGKSTTIKILIGILKSYTGRVRIDKKSLKEIGEAYYSKIGVAFETPNFYSKFTAMENLSFFQSLYGEAKHDPHALLKLVDLEEAANTKVGQFSKGMRMRLNFIRAIQHDPQIIFLDEPTSGLDPVNARKMLNFITELKEQGKTIIITTHNMQVAETLCDQIAFIVDGEIKLIDSPRNLKLEMSSKQVSVEYREGGQTQQALFDLPTLGANTEFIHLLQHKQIETIHTQEASLEDIFLKVTGRSLE